MFRYNDTMRFGERLPHDQEKEFNTVIEIESSLPLVVKIQIE